MTMLWLDGFDHYGLDTFSGGSSHGVVSRTNMLDGAYAEIPNTIGAATAACIAGPSWGAAATGAGCLVVPVVQADNRAYGARYVMPSTATQIFVGLRFAMDEVPSHSYANWVIGFRNGSNGDICSLGITSTGALELRDASNNTLGATDGPVLTAQNWQYLEMELDTVAGTFTLRVDDASGAGTPIMSLTGLSLASVAVAQLALAPQYNTHGVDGNDTPAYFDDFHVNNGAGSYNTGFLGDLKIQALYPASDTTTAAWTPRYRLNIGTGILDNTAADAAVTAPATTYTDLGSGDFTLEGFVRFAALPAGSNKSAIFSKWNEGGNQRSYQLYLAGPSLNSGDLCFQTSTDGTAGTVVTKIAYPYVFNIDQWYHVAVVRSSGNLLLFVNGQQLGLPIADSNTYFAGSAATSIGGQYDSSVVNTAWLDGWLDETRFTVGYARYTAPFTPTVVPFPRGGGDAYWSSVGWLTGFDSGIFDESSHTLALTGQNGAVQQTPDDGPGVGVFSTINKPTPADDTFIEADLVSATSILTLSANPTAGDPVAVGTTDGSTPAVYTFRAAVSSAYDVLIDSSAVATLNNLYQAINAGAGSGTKYGTGTVVNANVYAVLLPGNQMGVVADVPGTAGNSIASTSSLTASGGWTGTTLGGGANIPGPSEFQMQRPPVNTTVVAAVAVTARGYKTDSGTATFKSSLVGPHGGSTDGGTHSLTVSPIYYQDIFEQDPDTSGPISPTTIVGGRIRLTRTA